jgi:hypothetical protein
MAILNISILFSTLISNQKHLRTEMDTTAILLMTLLKTTLLIMTILSTLNMGDITYNGIAYN